MERNTQTFIACEHEWRDADIVLFGAPFDGTTSFRPGTRFGPAAVRAESDGIETYSPYQDKDLENIRVCDVGDLTFPFGAVEPVLSQIQGMVRAIVNDDKIPFMVGGEHLVTLGAVQALAETYSNLHVIQFDAHADLRQDYLGAPLSHATVMRRIYDLLGGHIHQLGIRSGTQDEFYFARAHSDFHPFTVAAAGKVAAELEGVPVYLTIDLDVLDPSIFPGTGTPEAGGVSFSELLKPILQLRNLRIVGVDVNELSPHYDQSGVSTAVACKLIRELLLMVSG